MSARNARLDNVGYRLCQHYAEMVTLLLEHWRDEERIVDGYPGGSSAPRVQSTAELTSVERAAELRLTISDQREELRDRIDGIETAVNSLGRFLRHSLGTRVPRHLGQLCGDWGDRKPWDGHLLAWAPGSRDDRNGWHDATCRNGAGWSGLCPTCLLRMNRWRERNGLSWVSEAAETAA